MSSNFCKPKFDSDAASNRGSVPLSGPFLGRRNCRSASVHTPTTASVCSDNTTSFNTTSESGSYKGTGPSKRIGLALGEMNIAKIKEECSDDSGAISVLPVQIVVNMYSQEYFSISVLDNGIGMSSDAHAALFRPLKSSKSRALGNSCSVLCVGGVVVVCCFV